MYELTAENVKALLMECLFTDEEVAKLVPGQHPEGMVEVKGIIMHLGLHKGRLEERKGKVRELLNQLPDEARAGPIPFLNLCMDKDGHQWGEHKNMDELMCLAVASELAVNIFAHGPGGLPIYIIKPEKLDNDATTPQSADA